MFVSTWIIHNVPPHRHVGMRVLESFTKLCVVHFKFFVSSHDDESIDLSVILHPLGISDSTLTQHTRHRILRTFVDQQFYPVTFEHFNMYEPK